MTNYWQVIVTNKQGLVAGSTFDNPFEALRTFGCSIHKVDVLEVMFHRVNSAVVTIGDKKTAFAEVCKLSNGDTTIQFHTDLVTQFYTEDVLTSYFTERLEGYKNQKTSISVLESTVIDLRTGKLIATYKAKED